MKPYTTVLLGFLIISSGNALAEDLPDWSGYHVGASAGVSFDKADSGGSAQNLGGSDRWLAEDVPLISNAFGSIDLDDRSASVGISSGYTMQSGSWLYGVDVNGQLRNLSHEEVKQTPYSGGGNFTVSSKISSNWEVSLTPRIGYAFDRWAVSGHAGVAVSDIDVSAGFSDSSNVVTGLSKKEKTVFGAKAGFGLDYALSDKWSVGGDYSYTRYQSVDTSQTSALVSGVASTSVFKQEYTLENHVFTLGVNYRF